MKIKNVIIFSKAIFLSTKWIDYLIDENDYNLIKSRLIQGWGGGLKAFLSLHPQG